MRQRVVDTLLDAHAVEDTHRVRFGDIHRRGAVLISDGELPQRDKAGRHLDRHNVALRKLIAALNRHVDLVEVAVRVQGVAALPFERVRVGQTI